MKCLPVLLLLAINTYSQKYIPDQAYKTSTVFYGFKGKVKKASYKYYSYFSADSTANQWRSFAKDSLANAVYLTSSSVIDFTEKGSKQFESRNSFYFKNTGKDSSNTGAFEFAYKLNDTTNMLYQFAASKHEFIYNSAGKLVEIKQVGIDTLSGSSSEFSYDSRGNLTIAKFWGNKNKLLDEYNYRYDSKDSLIEKNHYNYNRFNEFSIEKFSYEPKHRSWKVNTYLTNGRLYKMETFVVDDSAMSSHISFPNKSYYRKSSSSYRRYANGILDFTKYYDKDGKLQVSIKTTFKKWDKAGKPMEVETLNEISNKLTKQRYEYKYDTLGNITETRIFDGDNKLTSATLVSYEYY